MPAPGTDVPAVGERASVMDALNVLAFAQLGTVTPATGTLQSDYAFE
jgi:hypothetical protein